MLGKLKALFGPQLEPVPVLQAAMEGSHVASLVDAGACVELIYRPGLGWRTLRRMEGALEEMYEDFEAAFEAWERISKGDS